MKSHVFSVLGFFLLLLGSMFGAGVEPMPEDATTAVLRTFNTHDIVMLGEIHGNKQQYEWLRELVSRPEFAERVDDIVMEFACSDFVKCAARTRYLFRRL